MAISNPPINCAVFINNKILKNLISVSDVGQDARTSFAHLEIDDDFFNIMRLYNSGESFSCRIEYKRETIEATNFKVSDYSIELTDDGKCTFRIISPMAWHLLEAKPFGSAAPFTGEQVEIHLNQKTSKQQLDELALKHITEKSL